MIRVSRPEGCAMLLLVASPTPPSKSKSILRIRMPELKLLSCLSVLLCSVVCFLLRGLHYSCFSLAAAASKVHVPNVG
jgi:hypothetical protein